MTNRDIEALANENNRLRQENERLEKELKHYRRLADELVQLNVKVDNANTEINTLISTERIPVDCRLSIRYGLMLAHAVLTDNLNLERKYDFPDNRIDYFLGKTDDF